MSEGRTNVEEARAASVFQARLRFWLLTGVLLGVSVMVLVVLVLTQTRWGHERVLSFALRTASTQFDGTLQIQRLEGNLLAGARLYGIALRGPDDEPFILADSAYLEYSLRTIAGDEIVIDGLVLYNPEVYLRQMPGDTLWNYDRIFGDTLPHVEPTEPRRPLVVRNAAMISGFVSVEMPWEPDTLLSAAEQEREIREALADTSSILVREVEGGYLRTMTFSDVAAELSRVVSAPDELGGTSLRIERFAGDVGIFREPFPVRHLEADLAYREGTLGFRAPAVVLPSSRLQALGTVAFGNEDGPRLDVTVRGDTVDFADLQWLYPRLPEGSAALELVIETRPEGTLYLARDLRLSAPGTELRGSFGVVLNDTVQFVNVDLEADPLRVATVEAMLPIDFPVVGLRIGGVEIRQPAS